jgi:hypothetical protein
MARRLGLSARRLGLSRGGMSIAVPGLLAPPTRQKRITLLPYEHP